jgi:hypothetical protein
VISRKFDDAEAGKRVGREGDDKAKDDDGHLLKDESKGLLLDVYSGDLQEIGLPPFARSPLEDGREL